MWAALVAAIDSAVVPGLMLLGPLFVGLALLGLASAMNAEARQRKASMVSLVKLLVFCTLLFDVGGPFTLKFRATNFWIKYES